jgi:carbonic anhydrase/acetyltransferase-like protein (isoleucine patch superfamily)
VVGRRSNVQDGTVMHATESLSTVLGEDVVVGHGARLEGCTVEDAALIGMNSVVLHQVVVGTGAIIAAGAVVTPGTRIAPGAMARGVPARVVEADDQTREQRITIHRATSAHYWENAQRWMRELRDAD